MTIRESLYFSYDGIKSIDEGLYNVNLDSGLQNEPLAATRYIKEVVTRGRTKPYYQDTQEEPLVLPVSFAFKDTWDNAQMGRIVRWLCDQPYYKPLIFTSNLSKIYFAKVVESPELVHTTLRQGYVNLTFRTNDSVAYSPLYMTQIYECDDFLEFDIENLGHRNIKPEIYIVLPESQTVPGIAIYNQTNNNQMFALGDLEPEEEIYVHGEHEYIQTSLEQTYRYNNMEGTFIDFIPGINRIKIEGTVQVRFRFACKLLW